MRSVKVLSPGKEDKKDKKDVRDTVFFFYGCGLPRSEIEAKQRRLPIYKDIQVFGMEEMKNIGTSA